MQEISAVPQPRQQEEPEAAQPASSTRKKAAGTVKAPAKKAAARKKTAVAAVPAKKAAAAKKTTAKKAVGQMAGAAKSTPGTGKVKQPPLHQLVLGVLLQAPGAPRLSREVHDVLAKQHPDRVSSVQVVRNALETLVRRAPSPGPTSRAR